MLTLFEETERSIKLKKKCDTRRQEEIERTELVKRDESLEKRQPYSTQQ
jgi:hypothetical protein